MLDFTFLILLLLFFFLDFLFLNIPNNLVKKPFDFDFVWDNQRLNEEVPTLGDLQRMMAENFTAFITGSRSLDEFDGFIEELHKAGVNDWVNALTAQMRESWEG